MNVISSKLKGWQDGLCGVGSSTTRRPPTEYYLFAMGPLP